MFTIFTMKQNSRPFSDGEKARLFDLLDMYASTEFGKWMTELDYRGCDYNWCDSMTMDNGILGARPLFGKDIYLAPEPSGNWSDIVVSTWIEGIAPVAIHELRHLWQQKKYGKVMWSMLRLPEVIPFLYGKVFIEKDAFEVQEKAEKFIGMLPPGKRKP